MTKEFDKELELVSENEVPKDLLTPEENILFEQFADVKDVKLKEIYDASRSLFEDKNEMELRKLALHVYHFIVTVNGRQAASKTLLNSNEGLRGITRRNRATSVQRLRDIGRASMPSEPPPAAS
jgi:hypothetical protein